MLPLVHRIAYYLLQQARGEPVYSVLRELEKSEHWSADQLRAQQWERQRALVAHAIATTSYYAEAFKAVGVGPEGLRDPSDWDRLPCLSKAKVQEVSARMKSSRGPKGFTASTSGSSGTPISITRSHRSWAHGHANMIRGGHWHGIDVGERYAFLWGRPLDEDARRTARRKDMFFNRDRCSAFTLNSQEAREHFERLRKRRCTYAEGYPSALTLFAEELVAQGLDGRELGWRAIVSTAERLKPYQRERIEETFGCRVADSYGCAEVGVAGYECERQGLHIPIESVVVDLLPAGDGLSEVVLTDLHNYTQPVIRYRVGDLVQPVASGTQCPCGRRLPLLGVVFGRAGDTIELADGRRINANLPSYIFKKHGKAGTVREYQFVQFPEGVVELRVSTGPAWKESVREELVAQVREVLGVDVAVKTVPRFERRGRGKHRDFIRAEDLGEV